MEVECQHFGERLGCAYTPYHGGQQHQLLEEQSGGGSTSEEDTKIQKGTHLKLIDKSLWGGPAEINKS